MEEIVDLILKQDKSPTSCEQCGNHFEPRKHGGGSPQRFCGRECRMAWHSAQRRPACTLETATSGPSPKKVTADTSEPNLDFDWSAEHSVVLHGQLAVAIHLNPSGGLTDVTITIAGENFGGFIDQLRNVGGVGK